MFIIDNFSSGRFGNILLYYNNLVQIAHYYKTQYWAPPFPHETIFEFSTNKKVITPPIPDIFLTGEDIVRTKHNIDSSKNISLQHCLGELFYEFNQLETKDIFQFKKELIPNQTPTIQIGIHFRGSDFYGWNPDAILPVSYYIDSLEYTICDKTDYNITLYTEDANFITYKQFKSYLVDKNINYSVGKTQDLTSDFINLSYSDVIISSPSTFNICAGFCGKPDKIIIHNKKWVEDRNAANDAFWVHLYQGGNKNYKLYKLI